MKLICPACGAIASAESWMNDTDCREALLVISRLPSPLPKSVLGYLSLFRPGTKALSWKKVVRLAQEIEVLTSKGYVKVQGCVDRNCPASIWARAMEQMVEQRDGLSTLPNHNYLRKVAYDLADKADYLGEKSRNSAAATRTRSMVSPGSAMGSRTQAATGYEGPADPRLDPMEKARREWDEKHGAPSAMIDLNGLLNIVKGME